MHAHRQTFAVLAVVDVVLFLIASSFSDQSSTPADIVWWLAIAVFAVLIVAAFAVLIGFVVTRARRPRASRSRARRTRPRA